MNGFTLTQGNKKTFKHGINVYCIFFNEEKTRIYITNFSQHFSFNLKEIDNLIYAVPSVIEIEINI